MPTYDYLCEKCDHQFEEFQSITAKPLLVCPSCKRRTLKRLIGTGAGVIFKGSGFYQTDYRSESYKKAAEAEKAAPKTKAGETKPADTKATDAKSGDAASAPTPVKTPKRGKKGG